MMSFRYKDFRCRCHLYYKKLGGGEVARQCPHKDFVNRPDDWLWLCDHFDSEAFQQCGEIALFKRCYHNGKGWANDEAKKRYETMVNMQSQPPSDENEVPTTEQEICAQVLGTRYGYIPGRGHGPKPKSRREVSENQSSQLQEELTNTKTVLETQQSQIETQQSQIETQQSQIEAQRKEIEWLKTMVQQIIQMPSRNEDSGPSTTW
uniref:Uncharacterized protein n=1 Tax=Ananas comosus var. bracteatus TaxID=296719 RepID=A0A6V7QGV1_ANACO|nr:unnamed protein product [Ananas comosus var. bracteatus]